MDDFREEFLSRIYAKAYPPKIQGGENLTCFIELGSENPVKELWGKSVESIEFLLQELHFTPKDLEVHL